MFDPFFCFFVVSTVMSVDFSTKAVKDVPMNDMDPELLKWLNNIKLSRYAKKFNDIECCLDDLFLLDSNDKIDNFISDIGITMEMHRLKLRNEIKKLQNENNTVRIITSDTQNMMNDLHELTKNIVRTKKTILDKQTFVNNEEIRITKAINEYFDEYINQENKRRTQLLGQLKANIKDVGDVLNECKANNDILKNNIMVCNKTINDSIARNDDNMETEIKKEHNNIYKSNEYKMYTNATMNDVNIQFIKDNNDSKKRLTNLVTNLGSVVATKINNNDNNSNENKYDIIIPQSNGKWIKTTDTFLISNNGLTIETNKRARFGTIMFGGYISKSKNISSFECNIIIDYSEAIWCGDLWGIGFVTNKFTQWTSKSYINREESIFFHQKGYIAKSNDFECPYEHVSNKFNKTVFWLTTYDRLFVSINMNTNTAKITNLTKFITVTTKIPDTVALAIHGCGSLYKLKCTVQDYTIKYGNNNDNNNNDDKKENNKPQPNFKWINKTTSLSVTNNGLTFQSHKIITKHPTIMFGDYISKHNNISSFQCNIVIDSACEDSWAIGFITNKLDIWESNYYNYGYESIFFYANGYVGKSNIFECQYKHKEYIFNKTVWIREADTVFVLIDMINNVGKITNVSRNKTVITKIPDIVGLAMHGNAYYMELKCTVKDYKIKYR